MSEITTQIPNHTFISGEAISTAWNFTKKYFWTVIVLLLITMIPGFVESLYEFIIQQIPGATAVIVNPITDLPETVSVGVWATIQSILSIVSGIVGVWLGLGYVKANLQILEDKKPAINTIFSASWLQVARLIGGGILIGIAVIIGFIALILPGIWISVRLSLFQYYIAEGYGAIDSIKASWYATKDNFWKLCGIGFIYVGIIILGALALVVGLFWAIPTVALAQAYVYKALKKNTPTDIQPSGV